MPVKKNESISLLIESLSSDGSGVGRYAGEAIFVPCAAPGDTLQVRIVKDCGRYAFGIVEKVLSPSPARRAEDCAVAAPCGGCCFRHLDYAAELAAKRDFVADAFRRIGGLAVPVAETLASPQADRYRNKVQFPVGTDSAGKVCAGFYAGRTHRIVPCPDCLLQPEELNQIAGFLCDCFSRYGIAPYDEITGKGLIRHIFLRRGAHSGEIMVCLVAAARKLPHAQEIIAALCARFAAVKTVVLNVNTRRTNVILGEENLTLYGPGMISDTMCGVPITLGPLSFYQVNTPAAELLYHVAADFAALRPTDSLLDLYCGMGTIGLSMLSACASLTGVEVVPEAVAAAQKNAAALGPEAAAKTRFLCADAGQAAQQFAAEGFCPDVIVLDPPRKGCDAATLEAVVAMAPRRIVMISCNPATAARDARFFTEHGYAPQQVQPVDLFPRTKHVECCLWFCRA
ncbi:MAG: 23S rRNA (uracil(1939)-C(5))-methyltransferase RlmD [Faecalibacterium sp.]|jgi:23S rRNA (uracil1939-C5)-methyltransferase|nr:23S rRNA (uracil(1939)-C(5))-methyltransferase RlmD [Faecalibacterium sp.]